MIDDIVQLLEEAHYSVHVKRMEKRIPNELYVYYDDVDLDIEDISTYGLTCSIVIEWDMVSGKNIPTAIKQVIESIEPAIFERGIANKGTFKFSGVSMTPMGEMCVVRLKCKYEEMINND